MRLFNKYFKQEKGVAAIEFALIFPVYFLFIMGIIELGYVMWGYSALQYGASYGARYAFAHPTSSATTIQNYALSQIVVTQSNIAYTVTITPNVSAIINGTFTYSFYYLPLQPLVIRTQMTQILPPSS